MRGLLRVGSLFDERRSRVQGPHEVDADVRCASPRRLLVEDQLLGRGSTTAAVLLRPVQPGIAGVEETPLPVSVPRASFGPRVARRLRRERRQHHVEPRVQLGTKRFVGVRVAQLHEAGSLRARGLHDRFDERAIRRSASPARERRARAGNGRRARRRTRRRVRTTCGSRPRRSAAAPTAAPTRGIAPTNTA